MRLQDKGLIINKKKYGENSFIVKIFSPENGLYTAFLGKQKSKISNNIFQIGNLISFEIFSRSEDSLHYINNADVEESFLSKIIFDNIKLNCVNSIFFILSEMIPEKENHLSLFEKLFLFLEMINSNQNDQNIFIAKYIKLELEILKYLGYGLDLSCCVVTNSKCNLFFVSPKSGKAVSIEAGKKYQNKLLKLPQFLLQEDGTDYDKNSLLDGLYLSDFFIKKILLEEFGEKKQHNNFYRDLIKNSLVSC